MKKAISKNQPMLAGNPDGAKIREMNALERKLRKIQTELSKNQNPSFGSMRTPSFNNSLIPDQFHHQNPVTKIQGQAPKTIKDKAKRKLRKGALSQRRLKKNMQISGAYNLPQNMNPLVESPTISGNLAPPNLEIGNPYALYQTADVQKSQDRIKSMVKDRKKAIRQLYATVDPAGQGYSTKDYPDSSELSLLMDDMKKGYSIDPTLIADSVEKEVRTRIAKARMGSFDPSLTGTNLMEYHSATPEKKMGPNGFSLPVISAKASAYGDPEEEGSEGFDHLDEEEKALESSGEMEESKTFGKGRNRSSNKMNGRTKSLILKKILSQTPNRRNGKSTQRLGKKVPNTQIIDQNSVTGNSRNEHTTPTNMNRSKFYNPARRTPSNQQFFPDLKKFQRKDYAEKARRGSIQRKATQDAAKVSSLSTPMFTKTPKKPQGPQISNSSGDSGSSTNDNKVKNLQNSYLTQPKNSENVSKNMKNSNLNETKNQPEIDLEAEKAKWKEEMEAWVIQQNKDLIAQMMKDNGTAPSSTAPQEKADESNPDEQFDEVDAAGDSQMPRIASEKIPSSEGSR
jgi:hypothetical protein